MHRPRKSSRRGWKAPGSWDHRFARLLRRLALRIVAGSIRPRSIERQPGGPLWRGHVRHNSLAKRPSAGALRMTYSLDTPPSYLDVKPFAHPLCKMSDLVEPPWIPAFAGMTQ